MGFNELKPLELKKLMTIEMELGETAVVGDIGQGFMRIIPIAGGRFYGEGLNGVLLDYGDDWGITFNESTSILNTRYLLKTNDNELLSIEANVRNNISEADMMRAWLGEDVDPESYYMRGHISIKSASEKHRWLNERLLVCKGMIGKDVVYFDIYCI